MKHLMVDLETMSTSNNAAITAIGAVFFDPKEQLAGPEFYCNINLKSTMQAGFDVDGDTIYWWLQQSEAARQSLIKDKISIDSALHNFASFFKEYGSSKTMVWGNGATFDNVILANAYRSREIKRPWHYRCDGDIRTVMHLAGDMTLATTPICTEPQTAHNALSDCQSQINWFVPAYRKLKGLN